MMLKPSASPQKSQQRPKLPFLLSQSNKHAEPIEPHSMVLFLQPSLPQMRACQFSHCIPLGSLSCRSHRGQAFYSQLCAALCRAALYSSGYWEICKEVMQDCSSSPQLKSLHTRFNTYGMWAYFQAKKTSTHGACLD